MTMGQLSFADVDLLADQSLRDTTFVVVDLETTGGRANPTEPGGSDYDAITEIGAVKVRGGTVLGELATLVDPGRSIPPQIIALTGITSAMVCNAPTIDSVLPSFLEFSRGAVLVAHNAGFDIGFLRAAARRCQIAWPRPPVLCTVRLARRVLTRDEAPSVRLAALARLFGAATTPTHRALDDARATVDVLHGLIERVGNQGVHTYTDLRSYLPDVTPAQRRKRFLADGLPHRPGVYLFRGPAAEVLYVGTAVDLRRRVAQYFTGADPRTRIKEMATLATGVDHVECAHDLEAGVRELRLLAAHAPPYNRRSKFPHRWWWVVLTDEAFPRFSAVRAPQSGTAVQPHRYDGAVGPFRSRADAVETADLLARFTGVRTCTTRLARAALHGPACPERELSPCPARRDVTAAEYAAAPRRATELVLRVRQRRAGGGGGPHRRAGRPQPLRKRRAVARSRRLGNRRAVEGSAAARTGVGHRAGGGASGRQRGLAPRGDPARTAGRGGHRPSRCTANAGGRRHLRCGTSGSADLRAVGRGARRGNRADRALAGRARGPHCARRSRVRVPGGIGGPVGVLGHVGPLGAAGRRTGPDP